MMPNKLTKLAHAVTELIKGGMAPAKAIELVCTTYTLTSVERDELIKEINHG
jgi:hypothetical protein